MNDNSEKQENRPVHQSKVGGVCADTFINKTDVGEMYSSQIYKVYQDQYKQWQRSNSFSERDVQNLGDVLVQTRRYQMEHPLNTRSRESPQSIERDYPERALSRELRREPNFEREL